MISKRSTRQNNVIHLEMTIKASVTRVFSAFRNSRALNRWYDSNAHLSQFKVGGVVRADFFPSYRLATIVRNQLVAQEFKTVIDGIGLWSFVQEGGRTQLIFDHVAEGNQGEEKLARTFYWQGLVENLAAVSEGRPLPFVKGEYLGNTLPRGVQHRTCRDFVKARGRRRVRSKS